MADWRDLSAESLNLRRATTYKHAKKRNISPTVEYMKNSGTDANSTQAVFMI